MEFENAKTRSEEQTLILGVIYNLLLRDNYKVEYEVDDLLHLDFDEDNFKPTLFIKDALYQSLLHKDEIIKEVQDKLIKWDFERLNVVTQAIFLMIIAEVRYLEIPKAVGIDLAIKMAKAYCEEADYKFINAILDKLL